MGQKYALLPFFFRDLDVQQKKRIRVLRCAGSLRFGLKYLNLIEIRTCRHVRRSILILLLHALL